MEPQNAASAGTNAAIPDGQAPPKDLEPQLPPSVPPPPEREEDVNRWGREPGNQAEQPPIPPPAPPPSTGPPAPEQVFRIPDEELAKIKPPGPCADIAEKLKAKRKELAAKNAEIEELTERLQAINAGKLPIRVMVARGSACDFELHKAVHRRTIWRPLDGLPVGYVSTACHAWHVVRIALK